MTVRYFAYGSNIDADQMGDRAPSAVPLGVGRLDGYRLVFNVYSRRWEGGAANMEPDPQAQVWGVVWDIPDEELGNLDSFAGHPVFYRREQVPVNLGEGTETCFTYRVANKAGYVRPTDAYLERVRAGMRAREFPEEAFEALERAARPPEPTIYA
jgi:gamma-glutamylcyclotransferase